jgi:hypothetical protein
MVLFVLVKFITIGRVVTVVTIVFLHEARREMMPIHAVGNRERYRRWIHNARCRLNNDRSWIDHYWWGRDIYWYWHTNRYTYPTRMGWHRQGQCGDAES